MTYYECQNCGLRIPFGETKTDIINGQPKSVCPRCRSSHLHIFLQ